MADYSLAYRKELQKTKGLYEKMMRKAFGRVAQQVSLLANDPQAKFVKSFNFKAKPHLNKQISSIIADFQKEVLQIAESEITTGWGISNEKNDETVRRYFRNLTALKGIEASYANANPEALKAFLRQRTAGKTLSDRIWDTADKYRNELEIHLGHGIANGDSAPVISRRIRQYLNQPDALFRRVRDKNGKLILSEAAKKIETGRGKYRSAYKNALRVTRTETNRAYLYSDHLRWKQMDFVTGVKVEMSGQHPRYDMCDELQGDYPKNFVFTGWHPQCLCHATPILMPKEDFKRQLRGEKGAVKQINEVPNGFKGYVKKNTAKINKMKNKPYFIQDNYREGNIGKGFSFNHGKIASENASFRFAKERMNTVRQKYPNLSIDEMAAIHHYSRSQIMAYSSINTGIREGKLSEVDSSVVELMRSGIAKLPAYEGLVYRGTILSETALANYVEAFENSVPVNHSFFTSSSQDYDIARVFTKLRKMRSGEKKVMFRIESKSGKFLGDLSEFNGKFARQDQKEVIFNTGARFKVVDMQEREEFIIFVMKEL